MGAIDLPHPAGAQQLNDPIRTDRRSRFERRRRRAHRRLAKLPGVVMRIQQLVDCVPKRQVVATRTSDKRVTLPGLWARASWKIPVICRHRSGVMPEAFPSAACLPVSSATLPLKQPKQEFHSQNRGCRTSGQAIFGHCPDDRVRHNQREAAPANLGESQSSPSRKRTAHLSPKSRKRDRRLDQRTETCSTGERDCRASERTLGRRRSAESRMPSPNGDRRHRRPREPLHLERLDDERELVDALRRQLVELQVLEQVDAADDEHEPNRGAAP